MNDTLKLLDVVALTEDVPAAKLLRGQVGTIVELLGDDAYEVEFVNARGVTYALLPLEARQLMVLRYDLISG